MGSLKQLAVFFIMVVLVSATASGAQKTTVVIHNTLGGGLSLQYDCKSANDDFGEHTLAPDGSWSFRFKPDIFGRTLFFCRFGWEKESHYFDIYKQKRDKEFADFGCTQCEWKIFKTGPCKLNKNTSKFDVCLPWNS